MKESQWRIPGTARILGASAGVFTPRPRPSALGARCSVLGARTSHPRPPFTLNDHSQVRPGLPAYVARSCVIETLPANNRVAMVTVSGGVGVLMADDAAGRGLAVPPMLESPHRRMLKLVPFAAARNPVDVTGQFLNDPSLLDQAIELAATNGDYGSLVGFQGSSARNSAPMEATRAFWSERKREIPGKHFAVSGSCTPDYTRDLEAAGIPVYEEAMHATRAIAALGGLRALIPRAVPSPGRPGTRIPPRRPHQRARRPQDRRRRRPDRAARHAHIAREAADAASGLSFPVVLKVLSADILHKSDIGGVRLGVADRAAAETAFDEILAASRSAQPDAAIDGCLVAPMVTGGVETILGVQRDPVFGFIVMFGLGGIFVEALKDLTVRAAPFDEAEARTMIESVAAYPLLTGLRSQPPADLGALALDPVVVTRPPPQDRTHRALRPHAVPSAPILGIQSAIGNPESGGSRSPPGPSTTGPEKCAQAFGNPSDFDSLTGPSDRLVHVPRHRSWNNP